MFSGTNESYPDLGAGGVGAGGVGSVPIIPSGATSSGTGLLEAPSPRITAIWASDGEFTPTFRDRELNPRSVPPRISAESCWLPTVTMTSPGSGPNPSPASETAPGPGSGGGQSVEGGRVDRVDLAAVQGRACSPRPLPAGRPRLSTTACRNSERHRRSVAVTVHRVRFERQPDIDRDRSPSERSRGSSPRLLDVAGQLLRVGGEQRDVERLADLDLAVVSQPDAEPGAELFRDVSRIDEPDRQELEIFTRDDDRRDVDPDPAVTIGSGCRDGVLTRPARSAGTERSSRGKP